MERLYVWTRLITSGAPADLATVTVHDTGTDTLTTIYSDDGITPLANPFTASSVGYAGFYAANGRYDITVTPDVDNPDTLADDDPYTLEDVLLYDPED